MLLSASDKLAIVANLNAMCGIEERQLANPSEQIVSLIGGPTSAAGVRVTPQSSLSLSAVFAAVRNIAEDVGKLPLKVYRKTKSGREEADDHPLYSVLHDRPNPEMTAIDARTAVVASAVLYGNGYAEPVRNGFGDVVEWWPIEPWRVQVMRETNGRLVYHIDGGRVRFNSSEIFHLRSFNLNGIVGCMLSAVGQDSFGVAIAAQKFAAGFFARGGVPSGVITYSKTLAQPARDKLRSEWDEMHGGSHNGNRPAFFQDGMTYTPVGVDPQKAQMLETRKFDVEDVARWFRIPPHKIGHLERSTFSNIEHQSIEYVVDTLMPWCVRFEQESKSKLLSPRDADVFVKHNMDALLRGDTLSRQQAREIQSRNGVISIDEWRGSEDMNPLPDGLGGQHYVQLNMQPVEMQVNAIKPLEKAPAEKQPVNEDPTEQQQDDPAPQRSIVLKLLNESLSRCVRREVEVLRRASKKPDGFAGFVQQFYAEHVAYVRSHLSTVLELAGISEADIGKRIASYCSRSAAAIVAGDADQVLDGWTQTKSEIETRMLYEPTT